MVLAREEEEGRGAGGGGGTIKASKASKVRSFPLILLLLTALYAEIYDGAKADVLASFDRFVETEGSRAFLRRDQLSFTSSLPEQQRQP